MKFDDRQILKNRMRNIGFAILTISIASLLSGEIGSIATIELIAESSSSIGVPITKTNVNFAVAAFSVLGIILCASSYIIPGKAPPSGTISKRAFNKIDDMRILYNHLDQYATSLVPIDIRIEMMHRNPECFHFLEIQEFDGTKRIAAILMLFMLNKKAVELIAAGKLTGYDIRNEHIVKKGGIPSGCYIGFVWAADHSEVFKPFSSEAINSIIEIVKTKTRAAGTFAVFARPTTRSALRSLVRRDFVPIDKNINHNRFRVNLSKNGTL